MNSMKLYKKRDISVDSHLKQRLAVKVEKIRLPYINQASKPAQNTSLINPSFLHRAAKNSINASNRRTYLKSNNSRSIERVANVYRKQAQHSRVPSNEFIASNGYCSTNGSSTQLSTISSCFLNFEHKEKKYELISDYGKEIDRYLKDLE